MKNWKLMDNAITTKQKRNLADFILTTDRFSQGEMVKEFENKSAELRGNLKNKFREMRAILKV